MAMITRDKLLQVFPALQKAPPALVDSILSSGQYMSAPPDTLLLSEGQDCPGLVLMLAGEKRVYKATEAGREITLYTVDPGEFCILTAASTLSNSPYPANAKSITEVEMLIIPPDYFQKYISQYQEMRDLIFFHISKNFTDVMELITEVTFKRMDERLLDYLIEKSEDGKLYATHQTIANELGTAREVVSRLLKDFERRGIVILSRSSIQLLKFFFP
jgi:CRP/FNR family transcriptional regulator, anaerobic regulatory protein